MENDLLQFINPQQKQKSQEKRHQRYTDRYSEKKDAPYELILQTKWEDFAKYMYSVVLRELPKSERGGLGKDIRDRIWLIESLIVELGLKHGIDLSNLNKIDIKVKVLTRMLMFATEIMINKEQSIALIPKKRREPMSGMLVEIGRIIGGLKRSKNVY